MIETSGRERWHLFDSQPDVIKALCDRFSITPLQAKILEARGFNEINEEVESFLHPGDDLINSIDGLSDPVELKAAIERIMQAIDREETIMVNGDPDADGITATTIVVSTLRYMGVTTEYDFPTRSKEGHGLQPRIIDEAKRLNIPLIITTDCGSKDVSAAEYAKSLGIDVIVADHHILGKNRPDVLALVNPYTVKEKTWFKFLSGAGVALKLMVALFKETGEEIPEYFLSYLMALATLGTISDRMSFLSPLNRKIINMGIEGIKTSRMEGLKSLNDISSGGLEDLRPRDVSRTIVPRLNAPGRIGNRDEGIPDSRIVVDLLLLGTGQKNREKASEMVEKFTDVFELEQSIKKSAHGVQEAAMVDDVNEQRKYITSRIEDEIEEYFKGMPDVNQERIVIVKGKDWNPGVIGIDTDRLRERFLRPAMVLTEYSEEVFIRGSVRSIPKINMYRVLDVVSDDFAEKHGRPLFQAQVKTDQGVRLVNAFGGHAQACGFSLHKDDVEEFKAMVHEEMKSIPLDSFNFSYEIIDTLPFSKLSPKLVEELDGLMPYGQYFEYPLFYVKRCNIGNVRTFGNRYQRNRTPHMDFFLSEAGTEKRGRGFSAVGFGLLDKYQKLCAAHGNDTKLEFDVVCSAEYHNRMKKNGKMFSQFRLNVMDLRIAGEDNLD